MKMWNNIFQILLSFTHHTPVGLSDYTPLRCKRYRLVRCTPLVFWRATAEQSALTRWQASLPTRFAWLLKICRTWWKIPFQRRRNKEFYKNRKSYPRCITLHSNVILGITFLCIANSITVGNIVQINAVTESFSHVFSIKPLYLGIVISAIVFISIYKGAKRISDITATVIPIVTMVYIALSLYIIITSHL